MTVFTSVRTKLPRPFLGRRPDAVIPVMGGNDNRLWQVRVSDQVLALKPYLRPANAPLDPLAVEFIRAGLPASP